MDNACAVGQYLLDELNKLKAAHPQEILDVRGRGLMIGIELASSGADMRKRLLFDHHIFTGGAGRHTVRLLPALSLTKSDASHFINTFNQLLGNS